MGLAPRRPQGDREGRSLGDCVAPTIHELRLPIHLVYGRAVRGRRPHGRNVDLTAIGIGNAIPCYWYSSWALRFMRSKKGAQLNAEHPSTCSQVLLRLAIFVARSLEAST